MIISRKISNFVTTSVMFQTLKALPANGSRNLTPTHAGSFEVNSQFAFLKAESKVRVSSAAPI